MKLHSRLTRKAHIVLIACCLLLGTSALSFVSAHTGARATRLARVLQPWWSAAGLGQKAAANTKPVISGPAGCRGASSGITCPTNISVSNEPNQCGATVSYTPPTFECFDIVCNPAPNSFFPVGTTTVTCTGQLNRPSDSSNGNEQNYAAPTCSFTVTVQDTQPATLTCPNSFTVPNDPNQCGATVNYQVPNVVDNCESGPTNCVPAPGAFFSVGTTTVTCTPALPARPTGRGNGAMPGCGIITASSSQAITAMNSDACRVGDLHADNSYWRTFTLSSYGISRAYNVQSVEIGVELATSGSLGRTGKSKGISKGTSAGNGGVSPGPGQPLTVNLYNASQPFPTGWPGSLTLVGTATVTVQDQALSILTVPVTGIVPAGGQLVVEVFTPDGEGNGNSFLIGSNAAGETSPGYLSAPACMVTTPQQLADPNMHIVMNVNGCEQEATPPPTCSFTVTVEDTQAPAIVCPPNLTVAAVAGTSFAIASYAPIAQDNCGGTPVVNCVPPSGSMFPIGTTTVTCTASDALIVPTIRTNNLASTCSFTVTVPCPTVTFSPANGILPAGETGTPYNVQLANTPANSSYTYTVSTNILPPGLSLNAATGQITGVPLTPGNYTFVVTASGYGICSFSQVYNLLITATCTSITIAPATLPNGNVGVSYQQSLTASGGTAPYTFAVTNGTLPTGLSLSSAGLLSGTPTTAGNFNFTVGTVGVGNCTGASTYNIVITCPTIGFTPTTLAGATAGVSYSETVTATPAGSYTYSLTAGNLPAGLSLNATTGVISGMAVTTGTSTFTVKAVNAAGCFGTKGYSLTVSCPATISVSPANASLPNGAVGTAYSQSFSASPTGNYSFTVSGGALPNGLTLSTAGLLSGTPTVNGTFSFTVKAIAFGACQGTRTYTLVVTTTCPTITLPELPNGNVGSAYQGDLGGTTPAANYNFTVSAGALPPGLVLDSLFQAILGMPTTPGTYNFTLTATHPNNCTGSRAYTVTINGPGPALAQLSDYDGDGQADFSLWSPNTGAWRLVLSHTQQSQTQVWGAAGDLALAGDYDGDGKSDLAVFRPADGKWYIKLSRTGTPFVKAWGSATDIPMPGDYDGDGKTDLAIFRPSTGQWFVLRSSDEQYEITAWGSGAAPYLDVPVAGDYDGDGKTDLAVFRRANGQWLVKRSSNGQSFVKAWGLGTDTPVVADYDGDGKTDLAVWRASVGAWYIWQSGTGTYRLAEWGSGLAPYNDEAMPGDYDGDGRADVTVWRPADQTWYVLSTRSGQTVAQPHGQPGDRPVNARSQN